MLLIFYSSIICLACMLEFCFNYIINLCHLPYFIHKCIQYNLKLLTLVWIFYKTWGFILLVMCLVYKYRAFQTSLILLEVMETIILSSNLTLNLVY
jgi:hypothetical protein